MSIFTLCQHTFVRLWRRASYREHLRFHLPGLVDVSKVAEGFPENTRDSDVAFLMPRLEEAVDAVLAIAPLAEILHGPSSDHER
jgi:hypothetical protein